MIIAEGSTRERILDVTRKLISGTPLEAITTRRIGVVSERDLVARRVDGIGWTLNR